jgi:hypothetical protein
MKSLQRCCRFGTRPDMAVVRALLLDPPLWRVLEDVNQSKHN